MPALDRAFLKEMISQNRGSCAVCGNVLGVNYCRQCDEFFEFGHKEDCRTVSGHEHLEHRTYLSIWTVYEGPRDYPIGFIARRHEVRPGRAWPTAEIEVGTLAEIRDALARKRRIPLGRAPKDEPQIVESWA